MGCPEDEGVAQPTPDHGNWRAKSNVWYFTTQQATAQTYQAVTTFKENTEKEVKISEIHFQIKTT